MSFWTRQEWFVFALCDEFAVKLTCKAKCFSGRKLSQPATKALPRFLNFGNSFCKPTSCFRRIARVQRFLQLGLSNYMSKVFRYIFPDPINRAVKVWSCLSQNIVHFHALVYQNY